MIMLLSPPLTNSFRLGGKIRIEVVPSFPSRVLNSFHLEQSQMWILLLSSSLANIVLSRENPSELVSRDPLIAVGTSDPNVQIRTQSRALSARRAYPQLIIFPSGDQAMARRNL